MIQVQAYHGLQQSSGGGGGGGGVNSIPLRTISGSTRLKERRFYQRLQIKTILVAISMVLAKSPFPVTAEGEYHLEQYQEVLERQARCRVDQRLQMAMNMVLA